jgi:hypothetical protein
MDENKNISFNAKIESLNLEQDEAYSKIILTEVFFTFYEGSLESLYYAMLKGDRYKISLEKIKTI